MAGRLEAASAETPNSDVVSNGADVDVAVPLAVGGPVVGFVVKLIAEIEGIYHIEIFRFGM